MMMCIEYWVHVLEFPSRAAAMLERPNGSHYRMSKYPNGQPCAIAQLCCQFDRAEHSLAASRTIAGDVNGAAILSCLSDRG